MSSLRVQRAVLLAGLLALTGCCGGGGKAPSMETGALELPTASHATALPASWFLTAAPGVEVPSDALLACHDRGEVDDLELVYAVIEVSLSRIAVGGDAVMELDAGLPREGDASGYLLEPLYDAMDALFRSSLDLASAQCRPWTTGETFLPPVLHETDRPPVLLAFHREVPQATLARVLYTCGQASSEHLLLWVDDPDAASAGDGGDRPPGETGELQIDGAATVGDLAAGLDELAGKGVHCTTLMATMDELPAEPLAAAGGGVPRSLTPEGTVAVLPIRLPRVGMARAPGPPPEGPLGDFFAAIRNPETEALVTGHACPFLTVEVTVTSSPVLSDVLSGGALENGGVVGILEGLELSPVLDDGGEPPAE
jgi:hypothetical protein